MAGWLSDTIDPRLAKVINALVMPLDACINDVELTQRELEMGADIPIVRRTYILSSLSGG